MHPCAVFLISAVLLVHVETIAAQRTCFAGTFRDGKKCTVCPPGTFSDDFNLLQCKLCPVARFRATEGAKSREQCLPCPAGTFAENEGSERCTPCPPGEDSLPGSKTCGLCPAGTALSRFLGCTKCRRGFFADKPGSEFCKRCPDGTFAGEAGAKSCTKCPPGTIRRNKRFDVNINCERCQPGTYSAKAGAISCKLCPPGTFSGRAATNCTPCPEGTFSNRIPATRCSRCPMETSTAGTGASGCKSRDRGCAFNTFENKAGNCQACMPGERYDKPRKRCVPCEKNEVTSGGVDEECRACPESMVPVGELSFFEKSECECAPGFVFEDGKVCKPCPPGSFWENNRDNFKRTRPFGFGLHDDGVCFPCEVGTISDKPGSLFCKKCPLNTFQDFEGGAECMKCPPGSRSPRLQDSSTFTDRGKCIIEESACEPGQVRNKIGKCVAVSCPSKNSFLSKKKCVQCEAGFRAAGRRGCLPCGMKSTSAGGAPDKCTKCPNPKVGSRLDIGCECASRKAYFNGKCFERCPDGTAPEFLGSTKLLGSELICLKCPQRTVSNVETTFPCEECKDNTIAVNGTKCVPCPRGQVVERDIFGRLIDRCRPASP